MKNVITNVYFKTAAIIVRSSNTLNINNLSKQKETALQTICGKRAGFFPNVRRLLTNDAQKN